MIGRRPGELLVRVGTGVLVAGVLGVLAVAVPFLLGRYFRPVWLAAAYLSTLVGLGLVLVGLVRGTRGVRRHPPLLATCSDAESGDRSWPPPGRRTRGPRP